MLIHHIAPHELEQQIANETRGLPIIDARPHIAVYAPTPFTQITIRRTSGELRVEYSTMNDTTFGMEVTAVYVAWY